MMSSSNSHLSLRLECLRSFYTNQAHIYDIGCDHALLGLSFLETKGVEKIFLIDPSSAVISQLENKLKDAYITKPEKLVVIKKRGQEINQEIENAVVFIAGMGGAEIISILENLNLQKNPHTRIVLSPHRKWIELRAYLHQRRDLSLQDELILKDDQHFYQVLSLSPQDDGERVSLYGEKIWLCPESKEYHAKLLNDLSCHRDEASKLAVAHLKSLIC